MFIVLLLIIFYHVYTYTTAFSKIKQTKPVSKLRELVTVVAKDRKKELNLPPDDDDHGLRDLLDFIDRPVNSNDYEMPVKPSEPTYSIVELHQAQLEPPDQEESNIQNISEIEIYSNKNVSIR